MATLTLDPAYRRVSIEEFLAMDFGGAKAELDDGIIFMMAGGNARHALIQANVLIALRARLRGSGCVPYGSDFAAQTGERSIRFPDVSVHCGDPANPKNDNKQLLGDPQVIFEVLSPSTSSFDQKIKLDEYRALEGVQEVVLVDPAAERIRLVRRTGKFGWVDNWLDESADLELPSLSITVPRAEIFSRD